VQQTEYLGFLLQVQRWFERETKVILRVTLSSYTSEHKDLEERCIFYRNNSFSSNTCNL